MYKLKCPKNITALGIYENSFLKLCRKNSFTVVIITTVNETLG